MFNWFKAKSDDDIYALNRRRLIASIGKSVQRCKSNPNLSNVPYEDRLVDGALLLADLVCNPKLASHAYGFESDGIYPSRLQGFVIAMISLRGMLNFSGYYDAGFRSRLSDALMISVFPEINGDNAEESNSLLNGLPKVDSLCRAEFADRELEFGRVAVSFFLKPDVASYRNLENMKREIVKYIRHRN